MPNSPALKSISAITGGLVPVTVEYELAPLAERRDALGGQAAYSRAMAAITGTM
ncbi:hypothetical protein [Nocardia sp. NPDC051981]|uniref:hypothetical protein n=1 Tax=Nocardia sp. NPDC051981 TaxID=3155417 RepID=UPI0034360EE6